MIPKFNLSGVLPPFLLGKNPTEASAVAPYKTTLVDFVNHFATTNERKKILCGFIDYRVNLKSIGITNGFQWIDGSFVENVEENEGRAPNDIDLVTFAYRPDNYQEAEQWKYLVSQRLDLFHPEKSKNEYLCDAYFVDFALPPSVMVSHVSYWFGLFSHKRESSLWKGMLQIDLSEKEEDVFHLLEVGGSNAS